MVASLITFILIAPGLAYADECKGGQTSEVEVTVTGVRSATGRVIITIYGDNPADFLASGKKLDRVKIGAQPGTMKTCIPVPGPGTYAIALYHDEDNNNKVTRVLGIPQEGYGFSNDAPVKLGPPKFKDVKFDVSNNPKQLVIPLHYQ